MTYNFDSENYHLPHPEDANSDSEPELSPPAALGGLSLAGSVEVGASESSEDSFEECETFVEVPSAPAGAEWPSLDELPELMPLLGRTTTANHHRYDESETVFSIASRARHTPPEARTAEQRQLLDDIEHMKRFAPRAYSYDETYTPSELHSLVETLRLLSQKNRPDFNGLEGQMTDVVSSAYNSGGLSEMSRRVRGAIQRIERDGEGRRGMTWGMMTDFAVEASAIIRTGSTGIKAGGIRDYLITVQDPEANKKPDLTAVYQFAADYHALTVMGMRSVDVQAANRQTFVENCAAINGWYQDTAAVIAGMPLRYKHDRLPVRWELPNLIASMNARLEGAERSGRNKDYALDPAGAISLQLRIAHTVTRIRADIEKLGTVDESEIVPLED